MSKAKIVNPAMDGKVERGVDFNLKKDDLMLLILEGRKEQMEEHIARLQNKSTELRKDLVTAEAKFKAKVKKRVSKTLNAEALKMATAFAAKGADLEETGDDEEDSGKVFNVSLSVGTDNSTEFTRFSCKPIGEGKGSTYIKQQSQSSVNFGIYPKVSITMEFSIHGKTFAKKDDIFRGEVRPSHEYSKTVVLVDEYLNLDVQKEMPEYKAVKGIAEEVAANEQLLSDILAEYDLFSRNQPRAKANMIKQVLSRDESGMALLGNIFEAAKGVKLLQVEGPSNG